MTLIGSPHFNHLDSGAASMDRRLEARLQAGCRLGYMPGYRFGRSGHFSASGRSPV